MKTTTDTESIITQLNRARFQLLTVIFPHNHHHLFGCLKDELCGQHFPDNDAVIAAVRKWLASAGADFYERGIQALVDHWQKCRIPPP
jgi:hypothetical protein